MNLKAHRKILPAVLILLLSLALVSSATYAWFSMNTTVKGTGMSVTSTAPTNMLISVDTSVWENGITANTAVAGGFSPASTSNGTTFFALAATDGIDVSGGIVEDGVNREDVQLAQVNRVADSNTYYAEVALYVKAGEQTSLAEDLTMYLKRMTVDTTSLTDIANCVRVSVTSITTRNTGVVTFRDDGTVQDAGNNPLTETAAVIYKYDTVTGVSPITAVGAGGIPTLAAADPAKVPGDTTTCFTVDYTGAAYTTVIVRIWLEGQHEACVNEVSGESITVGLEWEASNYSA